MQEVNNESVKEFALKGYDGVLVTSVQEGTAASTAGLKRGDVILKLDNDKMNSRSDYDEKLSYAKPGDKINYNGILFEVDRVERRRVISVRLELPAVDQQTTTAEPASEGARAAG